MTMDLRQLTLEDHVLYLADHGVLICRPCRHAIQPKGGIRAHLQTKHTALPIGVRKALIEYAAGLPLRAWEDVAVPDGMSHLIPGLEIMDGWQCDECGLRGRCGCCWVKSGWSESEHSREGCGVLDFVLRKPYGRVRERLHYDENSCCYVCSRPGDWCEVYRVGEGCEIEDVVIPVCLSGWFMSEIRDKIKEMAGCAFSNGDEYIRWLGKGRMVNGVQGTNALGVFDMIVNFLEDQRRQ